MEELTIEGKTYISSKRAAAITGYAKDYIGQLCREGRVEARLVGRSWYVYEPSLEKHKVAKSSETEEDDSPTEAEKPALEALEAIWEPPTYESEPVAELPIEEKPEEPRTVEEIESEWREWFVSGKAQTKEAVEAKEPTEEEIPVHILREEAPAVVDMRRQEAPKRSARPERKVSKQKNLVLKAVLVAVILLSISIAVVGSGMSGSMAGLLKDDIGFIRYLEGIDEVRINK